MKVTSEPLPKCYRISSVSKNPFTLIELLVVVAIIMILMSILLPALGKAKNTARAITCAANLKQFALAHSGYSTDNEKYFTPYYMDMGGHHDKWRHLIAPYLGFQPNYDTRWTDGIWQRLDWCNTTSTAGRAQSGLSVFECPILKPKTCDDGSAISATYRINASWTFPGNTFGSEWPNRSANLVWFQNPSSSVLNYDSALREDSWASPTVNRHDNGRNILYVDGHVGFLSKFSDNASGNKLADDILKKY